MDIKILVINNVTHEEHDEFIAALEKVFGKDNKELAAERSKRYRANKKASQASRDARDDSVTNVTVDQEEEEREEERALPLFPPLPFPPLTPNPITPFNPPLPKEEEREEGDTADEPTKAEAPAKRKRGKLKNYGTAAEVMLSEEEFHKLEEKIGYPNVIDLIDELSYYMAENPKNAKKYTDHYFTLLNWDRRRKKDQSPKNHSSPQDTDDFLDGIEWEGMDE